MIIVYKISDYLIRRKTFILRQNAMACHDVS